MGITPHLLDPDTSFYVYDRAILQERVAEWFRLLPDVQPYYAVKCNPCPIILEELARHGVYFDCASPAEMAAAAAASSSAASAASDIIYANPYKPIAAIKYALAHGICKMTADNPDELRKIAAAAAATATAAAAPEIFLRIYACDPMAQCSLSNKFGAAPAEWPAFFETAQECGLTVNGVAFHVGSGAAAESAAAAFRAGIESAYEAIDFARSYGFTITTIDIGGGFRPETLALIAPEIRAAARGGPGPGGAPRFIAEPGRYFAEEAADLYVCVIGVREYSDTGTRALVLSDGIYGSFNCLLYDHADCPVPDILYAAPALESRGPVKSRAAAVPTVLYGPSCDGLDVLSSGRFLLPSDIGYGDYLIFRRMGAYTISGASKSFNGIPFADIPYYDNRSSECPSFRRSLIFETNSEDGLCLDI